MGDKLYTLNVHHDGMFFFHPLRYVLGQELVVETPKLSLGELVAYIEAQTGNPLTCLYYLCTEDDFSTMMKLEYENDVVIFFDVADSYGALNVYCEHLGVSLDTYVNNHKEQSQEEIDVEEPREGLDDFEENEIGENNEVCDKNEAGDDTEVGENVDDECIRTTEAGESSRHLNEGEEDGSDDEDYVAEDESDVESLASLDHLSEGEEEVRDVRKGKAIAKIPDADQLPKLGGKEREVVDERSVIHEEHDQFMKDLIEALKDDNNGVEYQDPLQPPPDEVPPFPVHDKETHWRLKRPRVGEKYEGPSQLKECLSYYALANGYSLWYERTCQESVIARCGSRPPRISDPIKGRQKKLNRYQPQPQKCKFRLYATWMPNERSFQIKNLIDEHTCARNFKYGSLINYKWIGRHFAERIRQQPDIKLVTIQDLVMKKYKCFVTHTQVKRARAWALSEYEKSLEEHYALLRPYADALLRTNPGSTVQLDVTVNPDEKTYFDRFYVCLFGLKEGWKRGCRKVVALDGCFLKTSCTGELLTAVGRDGNNQIYPIAWAIVGVENRDNWTWFIRLLEHDLDCPEGDGLTLISDQHKGLIEAVKEVMPRAEHRQCARHIYENFKKIYSGEEFRNLFWRAAKATYPAQFEAVMKEIKVANPNAYKYLITRNPKSWSRAFFELYRGCEALENGFSECWNSVLLKVRNKPIITLLEALRVILMIRLENLREESSKWEHDVCPAIRKKLDFIKSQRSEWLVIHAGGSKFEVRNYRYSYGVDIEERSCDCRLWELSGVPCVHAVQAIFKLNQEPEDYIAGWFRQIMYTEAYNKYLNPVGGMDTWLVNPELSVPLPPKPRTMPGRPKKNRQRAAHEPRIQNNRVTKHGVVMTCSKCLQRGHNVRGCKSEWAPRPAPTQNRRKRRVVQSQPTGENTTGSTQTLRKKRKETMATQTSHASQSHPLPQSNPTSPGKKVGYTKGGFMWVGSSTVDDVGSSRGGKTLGIRRCGPNVGKGRGGTRVAFGRTVSWVGSGFGSSGTLIRDQARPQGNERITMTAPTRNPEVHHATQESVSRKTVASKKQTPPVKTRIPSQRIINKKLGKKVTGPGSTFNDALTLE